MRSPSADAKWSAGSIRITSGTVRADEVSARLGIVPDELFEQGSLTSPRNPRSTRRQSSVWIRHSGLGNDSELEEHVAALVRLVSGRREELTRLSAECDLELYLGFGSESGQGACVLPAPLLAEVGGLGFAVVLDLYPPTSEVGVVGG